MTRPPSATWLAACTAAWSLLLIPATIEAFYAGRVFESGPVSVAEWIVTALWASYPVTLVVSMGVMWRSRNRHPFISWGTSFAPLVQLAVVAVLVVVVR